MICILQFYNVFVLIYTYQNYILEIEIHQKKFAQV